MSTLISVSNKGENAVQVIVQTIADEGRELHINGQSTVAAGKSKDFLIDAEQSVRVVGVAPEAE